MLFDIGLHISQHAYAILSGLAKLMFEPVMAEDIRASAGGTGVFNTDLLDGSRQYVAYHAAARYNIADGQ